jgi:hypothetical protein
MRRHLWLVGLLLLPLAVLLTAAGPASPASGLVGLVAREDFEGLRAQGPKILPEMARLYTSSDTAERTRIAGLLYRLGWKSPEAASALMRDVRTQDVGLRIAVQYALGRVSDQPAVVDALLRNMTDDPNPVLRDKAACALAYDQIHLSEAEKVRIYEGLIKALDSEQQQVREIAIQALQVHTGQRKGFIPFAPVEKRRESIARWRSWLAEYKENL